MSTSPIDADLVRELATLLDETSLSEIEIEKEGLRVRVARQVSVSAAVAPAPVAAAPAAASAAAPAGDDLSGHPGAVTAPMVGVIYASPEPGAEVFVNVGDMISEGQTVFLIEAMKTFNPVRAHKSGKISQILVSDGTPVEYGEPLLVIE